MFEFSSSHGGKLKVFKRMKLAKNWEKISGSGTNLLVRSSNLVQFVNNCSPASEWYKMELVSHAFMREKMIPRENRKHYLQLCNLRGFLLGEVNSLAGPAFPS